MRLRVRLQTLLTAALAVASLGPILMTLLLDFWENRQAEAALQGETAHRLWLTVSVACLSLAVAFVLGRAVTGLIGRSLADVLDATDRLARGESGIRVSPAAALAPREVSALVDRFNHLSDRLGDTHHVLVESYQGLEQRVAERTHELEQRNVDLGYSRATLYAVMESLNDGLVLITPDRRIRYINRNTESLLQFREAFFPGRSADELYRAVAESCAEPAAICQQLGRADTDAPEGLVLQVRLPSHSRRYLRWRTFPIRNATGANLGLGHILTDVTQERELDRVKSELIATVSHELRTPLTAIRASASSLLRSNVEWDEETRSDFLLTISEESKHLQELIENLLDMSKIEAGVLKLDTYPTGVGPLLDGAAARVRPLHPDWTITLLVPPGLPAVNVDRRRMEQVLLNLVDNAIKYGAGSRVVEIRAGQHGREVTLSVHDEGIGIPAEHRELIFQRFHRVDSKLTRNTGGSGLGLAICRGIVEAHQGRIWVESELGRGSAFFVALPALQEE
jgi:signal transduction histidine kinase